MIEFVHVIIEIALRVVLFLAYWQIKQHTPFIRHIDEDELWMYRYPSVDSYVSKNYLHAILLLVPAVILLAQYLLNRRDDTTVLGIINAIEGITLTYGVIGLFVELLKIVVGMPRPNFFFRCFPDGYGTDIDACSGEYNGVMDGRKSFPSGHSALSFGCMIYMMLHLRETVDMRKPRFCRGLVVFMMWMMPLAAAILGASRFADYHHHLADVVGGAVIGSAVAYVNHRFYKEGYTLEEYQELIKAIKRN